MYVKKEKKSMLENKKNPPHLYVLAEKCFVQVAVEINTGETVLHPFSCQEAVRRLSGGPVIPHGF